MDPKLMLVVAASAVLVTGVASLMADVDGAKGYIKQAQDLLEKKDYESAANKLELAETELDGVDAGAKAPLVEQIKAVRLKVGQEVIAAEKPKYERKLRRAIDDAESAIGNMVTWGGAESAMNELLKDDMAKAVLGADLETAGKKFATFKKLHMKKAGAVYAEQAERAVKQVEELWAENKAKIADPDTSPNSKEAAIEKTERWLNDARKEVAKVPADDDRFKAMSARLDKVGGEFAKVALADRVKEVKEQLARSIDLYKNDWEGYEKETTGPTWEQFQKEAGGKMSAFYAPKTIEFISRMDGMLKNLSENENYVSVQGDESIKAIIDGVKKNRDAAAAKMLKIVTPVVEAAEKAPVKDAGEYGRLRDGVRSALGETEEGKAMVARLDKKISAYEAATTGAEEARVKLAADLTKKAEQVWPGLYAGMPYDTEFDVTNAKWVGKPIGFLADNLMGYRFKPGDFYFATTLGGHPVAAKIDPALMAQISTTEKAIGRRLGDNDNDGKWDVIAVVTDRKVKLMAKREVEAKGNVDGANVTIKGEYAEPVDAIVIEIIAAKCGPFAGSKGKGVLTEKGEVAK